MPRTGLSAEEILNRALDTAELEIRKNGVERLRLTDIAREMGISHSSLYKHFADKEALLDCVSKRWLDRIDEELERVSKSEDPPVDRIKEYFRVLHKLKREKVLSDPRLFGAFSLSADKTRPFVIKHLETSFRILKSLVEESMHAGEFHCDSAETGANILFQGTLAFHHPKIVFEKIEEDRMDLLNHILDTLILGLSQKNSP